MHIAKTTPGAEAPNPGTVNVIAAAICNTDLPQAASAALRVATYARYSTDGQKETSIDDQVRTCEETAKRHGMVLSKALIFADDAITGAAKATHKREQYHALREAIRAGKVDVIICDQQCRLARSAKESLTFFDELKEHKVRLLTADGFDSEQPTSQLLFGIKSVFSEFFLDETRHRVRRGMIGEFDRGAMVTAVPYGYQVDVVRSAKEGRCLWCVHPEQAEVVKEMFRLRKDGMSLNQIAAVLNGRRVPTPFEGKKKSGLYWRASAVWRILQNPTYKGVYVVNFGSDKTEERKLGQRLMADLALVSVADWDVCQADGKRSPSPSEAKLPGGPRQRGPRGSYGGGKHPLAGVLRCGVCGVPLSCHKGAGENGTMHCIQCEHATIVGVPGRQPQYVSIRGVRQMLAWLLEKVITGEAVPRYQECLRERLAGGHAAELATARQELDKAERTQQRLSRLLQQISGDDPVLEQQYLKTREDALHFAQKVRELEQGLRELNQEAIQKQLDIDLSVVVEAFLSDQNAPERTRALLNRVFPAIVLEGKTDRYTAIFRVEVKPGAILAEASGTAELVSGNEVMWVRLKTSGSKRPVWSVEEIPPLGDESVSVPTAVTT
jgi:site-specific DNA recombinase